MEFGLDSTVIFAWWRRRNMSAGLFMRRRIPATGHSFAGLSGILNRYRLFSPLPHRHHNIFVFTTSKNGRLQKCKPTPHCGPSGPGQTEITSGLNE
jgi:hypothetical protein